MWCKRIGSRSRGPGKGDILEDTHLHAYVDDALGQLRRLEVEEYLAERPREAARIRDFQAQNRTLHQIYDRILSLPLPPEIELLEYQLFKKISRARRLRMYGWVSGSAAATLAIAIAAGTFMMQTQQQASAVVRADASVPAASEPRDRPVATMATIRPVKSDAGPIFSSVGRLDSATRTAPDLKEFGLALIGTRLISRDPRNEAVQYSFEAADGRRVLLYISRPPKDEKQQLSLIQQGAVSVLSWKAGERFYNMIGEIEGEALLAIGRALNAEMPQPAFDRGKTAAAAPTPAVVKKERISSRASAGPAPTR